MLIDSAMGSRKRVIVDKITLNRSRPGTESCVS